MNYIINENVLEITLEDGSFRKFKTEFPKKFDVHGFLDLNVVETLEPKLKNGDYSRMITDSELHLGFTINIDTKYSHYKLILKEIINSFDSLEFAIECASDIPNGIRQIIKTLNHKINELNNKIEDLKSEIEDVKSIF